MKVKRRQRFFISGNEPFVFNIHCTFTAQLHASDNASPVVKNSKEKSTKEVYKRNLQSEEKPHTP